MTGLEVLFLTMSSFVAGYCLASLLKGEKNERSSRNDDGQRNDKE